MSCEYPNTDSSPNVDGSQLPVLEKGQLFVGSAAGTAILPPGANGLVLKTNSLATTGLEWSTTTTPTDITLNSLRFNIGTPDVRLLRGGNPKTLVIDDSGGGDATLSVSNVISSSVDTTSLQTAEINIVPNTIDGQLLINHLGLPRFVFNTAGLEFRNGMGISSTDSNFSFEVGGGPGVIAFNGAILSSINTMSSSVTTASTRVTTPLITTAGDLSINPAGSVNFNNKTLNNCNLITATVVRTQFYESPSGTNIEINPATGVINTLGASIINCSSIGASSSLQLAPATDIDCTNKPVIGVSSLTVSAASNTAGTVLQIGSRETSAVLSATPSRIDLGSGAASSAGSGFTVNEQKFLLYSRTNGAAVDFAGMTLSHDGVWHFTLGNQPTFRWAFVRDGVVRTSISATGQLAVQTSISTPAVITAVGDLSINPAGSNVNFNGKNIINANFNNPTFNRSISTTTQPAITNWQGSAGVLIIETVLFNSSVDFRIRGSVTASTTNSIYTAFTAIPAGHRPAANREFQAVFLAFLVGPVVVTIDAAGIFSIQRLDGGTFSVGTVLNFSQIVCYGRYFIDA